VTADVVVVGAGVIGAAPAFHLSLLGAGDVFVLDRATAGSGMSCRSSALVRMHYTFGPEVELAVRSDAMFAAWPDLVGRPGCVRRTGFVRIVAPGEEAALRANVAMQRALGARAGVWSPPLLRTAGVVLPIETELHRVAVLAHPPAGGAPVACIDSTTQTYFRPEAGGAMTLVGAFAGQRGADPDAGTAATGEDLRRWSRRRGGGYRHSRTPASHAGSPACTT
jgi:glycine/D-amino acid oxidase-like deaminating enzyme